MISDSEYLMKLYQKYNREEVESGVEVILEPMNFEGLLRSLELVYLFNFRDVTCPISWIGLQEKIPLFGEEKQPNNLKHHHFKDLKIELDNNKISKLVCVTNLEIETMKSKFSIKNIVNYFKNDESKKKILLLIIDDKNFKIHGWQRKLKNLSFVGIKFEKYLKLLQKVKNVFKKANLNFCLNENENLYFQQIAMFHNEISGVKPKSFLELFYDLSAKPYSPLWKFLLEFKRNKNLINELYEKQPRTKGFRFFNTYLKKLNVKLEGVNEKNEFLNILKSTLKDKNKCRNFHIDRERKKKIKPLENLKIKELYSKLRNQENQNCNFLFRRLKEFCIFNL